MTAADPLAWLRQAAGTAQAEAPQPRPAATPGPREPSPASNPMAWADGARCLGMDPSDFYPGRGEEIPAAVVAACRTCPVAAECLAWALRHERYGYWAGQSERGRRRLRKTLGIVLDDAPAETVPAPAQEAS